MTERLAEITGRIENMRQLGSVVTVMRGIAATRAQQSRALISGIEAYTGAITNAIGQALNLIETKTRAAEPNQPARRGVILFCAEQGFAGAFTSRIIDAASERLKGETERPILMLIGTRGAAVAAEERLEADWKTAMANQIEATPEVARRIADEVYARVAAGEIFALDMFFAKTEEGRALSVVHMPLLPIDLQSFKTADASFPPITTLSPELLIARLTDEYIYAKLCEAAMHSFAAENDARMSAMTAARDNIDRTLGELMQREAQVRQDEVTAEIVELAAGVEAQRKR
ncbi:MAG: ATPase [Alphaproteobacteria bacterium]|nr:ATPase [Alphaproteobacteria bacterium]